MAKIVLEFAIYTYQIDFLRHVSNIVYLQWMEAGRAKLLELAGIPIHMAVENGIAPVLVETQICYKRPLVMGESIRLEMWISELRSASAWLEFRIYNDRGDLAATAKQRGMFVDAETMRPKRMALDLAAHFAPFVGE